jgi:transcriptional regulator with XRE-family HTH domain
MIKTSTTDTAVLDEIGDRLSRCRVSANLTQAELARQAGVGRSTVERLEAGHSTQLANFIRIVRVLKLLDPLIQALPEPGVSPIDLLEAQSGQRKRARRKGSKPAETGKPWRWGDEE